MTRLDQKIRDHKTFSHKYELFEKLCPWTFENQIQKDDMFCLCVFSFDPKPTFFLYPALLWETTIFSKEEMFKSIYELWLALCFTGLWSWFSHNYKLIRGVSDAATLPVLTREWYYSSGKQKQNKITTTKKTPEKQNTDNRKWVELSFSLLSDWIGLNIDSHRKASDAAGSLSAL